MKKTILLIVLLITTMGIAQTELVFTNIYGGSGEVVSFKKIDEGETLAFNVEITGPNNPTNPIQSYNLPAGSTFSGTSFIWTPGDTQAGMYNVSFSTQDPNKNDDVFKTIRIIVTNTRLKIGYNRTFQYLYTATDPDQDNVEITADGLPSGATFVGSQFNPKLLTWTPTKQQSGEHIITLTARDHPINGTSKTDVSILRLRVVVPGQEDYSFDYNNDNKVDLKDFSLFAQTWLYEYQPDDDITS